MKIKIILLSGYVFCTLLTYGQTETFDILTYSAPAGYARQQSKDGVQFTRVADDKASFCKITVYVSRAGTDDIKKEFTDEWISLIKNVVKFTVVEVPSETQAAGPDDGWNVLSGESLVKRDAGNYVVMLICLAGHGRVTSLIIEVNTDSFNPDIEKFVASLKPETKTAEALTAAAIQQQAPTVQNPAALIPAYQGKSPITGVWWALGTSTTVGGITNAAGTGYSMYGTSTSAKITHIAFFEDGTFCGSVQSDGLLDYKQDRAKDPTYYGTYTFQNGTGVIQLSPSVSRPFSLENGILVYYHNHFYKTERFDDVKLDGTYIAEKNPSAYQGPEPTITFSPHGRFDDHGAIYWTRHVAGYSEDMQDKMTGSGTYAIFNYTITFKYDDGRLIKMTFLDTGDANRSMPKQIRLGNHHLLDRK